MIAPGVKVWQKVRKSLIPAWPSGLQSRLRRFDSDPSLQNAVLRRPNKVDDVANTSQKPVKTRKSCSSVSRAVH